MVINLNEQDLRDLLFNIKEDLEHIRKTIDKMIKDIESSI